MREHQGGQPGERVGRQRRRRRPRSRASPRASASTRAQTVSFKVDTAATAYRLDIYRMGYYGGQGARKIATVRPSAGLPQNQPDCLTTAATGLVDCGNWAVSASLGGARRCGLRHLLRQARARVGRRRAEPHLLRRPRRQRLAPTCCSRPRTRPGRPTTSTAATASTSAPAGRAAPTRSATTARSPRAARRAEDWVFNAEYPMVRWLEAQRLRRQLLHVGVDTRPARRRAARAQDVPVRRPRRVLVGRRSAPTSRPRARPA